MAWLAVSRRGRAQTLDTISGDDPAALTVAEAGERLRKGRLTSVRLVESCLARIKVYDPKLNAFITVLHEQAMARARECDAEIKAGNYRGPLHGIPIRSRTTSTLRGFAPRRRVSFSPIAFQLKMRP